MTVEELDALLGDYTWEDFEGLDMGEIRVTSRKLLMLRGRGTLFKMRVGLYMGRPMQAIIAEGQFVRMRPATQYEGFELKRLDCTEPDECVYEGLIQDPADSPRKTIKWWPPAFFSRSGRRLA